MTGTASEGMLAAAVPMPKWMRLEGLLGDETDPAADSLRGQLAAANARIGSAADADSLEGQLAAAKAQIDNDDPDNLGLMQQLAAAKVALAKIEMETEAGRNAMTVAERIARARGSRCKWRISRCGWVAVLKVTTRNERSRHYRCDGETQCGRHGYCCRKRVTDDDYAPVAKPLLVQFAGHVTMTRANVDEGHQYGGSLHGH